MKVRDKETLHEGATHRVNLYMPTEVMVGDCNVTMELLDVWDPKRKKWLDFIYALEKGIVEVVGYNICLRDA